MARLALNPTGIRGPLDVGPPTDAAHPEQPASTAAQAPATPPATARQPPTRRRTRPKNPPPPAPAPGASARFYGGGYPIQTSIAVDGQLLGRAIDLSRAAAVSFTTLVVATLQADLPSTSDEAVRRAVLERADHGRQPRVERNVRLPRQLRTRLDELLASHAAAARVTRADLINTLLREHLPDTAEDAATLCAHYARQQALASIDAA